MCRRRTLTLRRYWTVKMTSPVTNRFVKCHVLVSISSFFSECASYCVVYSVYFVSYSEKTHWCDDKTESISICKQSKKLLHSLLKKWLLKEILCVFSWSMDLCVPSAAWEAGWLRWRGSTCEQWEVIRQQTGALIFTCSCFIVLNLASGFFYI